MTKSLIEILGRHLQLLHTKLEFSSNNMNRIRTISSPDSCGISGNNNRASLLRVLVAPIHRQRVNTRLAGICPTLTSTFETPSSRGNSTHVRMILEVPVLVFLACPRVEIWLGDPDPCPAASVAGSEGDSGTECSS